MPLTIGDDAPNFNAQTTDGEIRSHDRIGDSWAVLFSHPHAFTPICSPELGYMASIQPEFDHRDTKIIAISTDPVEGSRGGRRTSPPAREPRSTTRSSPTPTTPARPTACSRATCPGI